MTREQWLHKYKTDPEFRLKRLMALRSRNYRKQGGFPSRNAYDVEVEQARKEIEGRSKT